MKTLILLLKEETTSCISVLNGARIISAAKSTLAEAEISYPTATCYMIYLFKTLQRKTLT